MESASNLNKQTALESTVMEFGSEENVLELLSTSIWCFLMASSGVPQTTSDQIVYEILELNSTYLNFPNVK
jgi:hypothetical protein